MTDDRVYHVLFLSRRNAARSIIAEAVLNKIGNGRFKAYSAGMTPLQSVDPRVYELLVRVEMPFPDARPRHYEEFTRPGAPLLDFVFTLSDTAAGEALPRWPGRPVAAHWSARDPFLVEGEEWEKKQAFGYSLAELERRLTIFINLPFATLNEMSLRDQLKAIASADDVVSDHRAQRTATK